MKNKLKALSILLLMGMMVLITGTLLYANTIPQMINYSGSLTDTGGTPVANGNYNIEFKIYDVASGGASLWSEKWDTTTSQITVVGGIFNVMLGFKDPIPAGFFADHPVTYLGIKVGTDSEMLPRQQITSVGYAFTAGNGVPKGGVIMWSGAIVDIPAGWALCDGNNGTPNLRDRFIVGAGSEYAVGATGGEKMHTLIESEMPSHSHTQNLHTHIQDAHTHIQNAHRHNQAQAQVQSGSGNTVADNSTTNEWTTDSATATNQNTTPTNQNTTATNQNTGGGAAHENRPPYYALAFIMKL